MLKKTDKEGSWGLVILKKCALIIIETSIMSAALRNSHPLTTVVKSYKIDNSRFPIRNQVMKRKFHEVTRQF